MGPAAVGEKMSLRLLNALQSTSEPPSERNSAAQTDVQFEADRLNAEIIKLRLELFDAQGFADTDPLLPIYNRRAFMRELTRASAMTTHYDITSSIICFDLNGFKSINDRFGHAIGDELLKKVGNVLMDGVRGCDLVARLGGDEFGVLLFKTDAAVAKAKASVLACRIADETIELPTGNIQVTTAWGVAPCERGQDADQVLARADRAMYVAKRAQA